jgi:serine/threonine protein kinase
MTSETKQTIGKYTVETILGRTPTGVIYKARDPEIERYVSIKTWTKPYGLSDEDAHAILERFTKEAQALGILKHQNILSLFEVQKEGTSASMVMDYIEGETLDSILTRVGALTVRGVLALVAQISSAIDYAHDRGVIHGDLRPACITLDSSGNVYVSDFGLSTLRGRAEEQQDFIGSAAYAAPEVLRGEFPRASSDIFSCAVVAFECLTGTRPFHGDTVSALLQSLMEHEPRPASMLVDDMPEQIDEVFRIALSRDPKNRYGSIQEFQSALEGVLTAEAARELQASKEQEQAQSRMSDGMKMATSLAHEQTEGEVVEVIEGEDSSQSAPENGVGSDERTAEGVEALKDAIASEGEAQDSDDEPDKKGEGSSPGRGLTKKRQEDKSKKKAARPDTESDKEDAPEDKKAKEQRKKAESQKKRAALVRIVILVGLIVAVGATYWVFTSGVELYRELKETYFPKGESTYAELEHVAIGAMKDSELKTVLMSGFSSESRTIDSLHEALRRKLDGLGSIATFLLGSNSYLIRIEALKILGVLKDEDSYLKVLAQLEDNDPLVRLQVIRTLLLYGEVRALPTLVYRARNEKVPEIKLALDSAIQELQEEHK